MFARLALAACLALAAALPAARMARADLSRVASAEILPGWREAGGRHVAALRVRLAPGWKTYWRAPGDAGIPPRFDWAGSGNIRTVRFHWPVPDVFDQNGMSSIGYHGELLLPFSIETRDPGAPIRLRTEVELGVCEDVCLPLTLRLAAELPAGGAPDPAIRAALADRPATAREAGVGRVECEAAPIRDGMAFAAQVAMPPLAADEVAVIEFPDPSIWIAETETTRAGNTLTARTELVPENAAPFLLDRSKIRITVLGGGRAVEISGCGG